MHSEPTVAPLPAQESPHEGTGRRGFLDLLAEQIPPREPPDGRLA